MAFGDLSDPEAVVQAINEFDALGRAAFLTKYRFGEARDYFVEYAGRRYDSQPIAAAAHGFQFGAPLTPGEFSGGDATVATRLERLGFIVTRPVSLPDWTRDELILALDAYLARRGVGSWSKTTKEAVKLSALLRSLTIFPEEVRQNARFRNPAGVALKASNFAAIDPQHGRTGMPNGSRGDQEVWDEWAHRPDELRQVALAIRRASGTPAALVATEEDEEAEADEGRLLYRLHRRYERNRTLVERKKNAVRAATGRLACEVCDFESTELYGDDVEVIDVHHIVPLHRIGESRTSLKDLALVCPTCHRVLHAHKPFITPAELRTKRTAPGQPEPLARVAPGRFSIGTKVT